MTLRLAFEWMSLILLIGLGVYTMWIIKNEKKAYIKNARIFNFKHFKLLTPSWWEEIPTNLENEISFKRIDGRYDWEARFFWNPLPENTDLFELFKKQVQTRKIRFDEGNSIIYNPTDFSAGELMASGRFEIVRLEGTATTDSEDRLYYDAFLIREKENGSFLYAESKSSVLNGLIEGPYFEEVMMRIELI